MASPNISFEKIPASIRKPGKYIEFNTRLAVRTLPANAQEVLILGQRLAGGEVPALTPTRVFSDAEAAAYFGQGSMLHRMVRAAIRAYPYISITCLALDDAAAGVAATGTATLAGTATGSGVATVRVGLDLVQVAVASGDTAADVAAALAAQASQQPDLPVTFSANAGVLTLTARHKGALGNAVKIAASCTAPGLSALVSTMAGGETDPGIAAALAVVASAGHDVIITPYADETGLTALREHLEFTGGPLEQRGAVAAYALTGTLASATTLAGQVNHGRISGALLRGARRLPWEIAAAYGAVIASEEDPARPLNTLTLTGVDAPDVADRLTRTEQEVLLRNGVTPLEVGPDGTSVQIVRAITTYTVDPQGIEDVSLLDLTTIRTLDYVRKAVRERVALRFPREKLSSRTPPAVRGEILDVLRKLEELEIVEEVEANKDGVICERDSQDVNRLNAKIPTDVVNGLHVFAGRIDLLL
ncbi:Mu-like prophage tail sheath protein gpL [Humidesulfovibrio mexicanus]|uniref:Mu-like prophage tail sheath protein gpL n=1 Tax=Humidesulfovibrio mexicanus TaxID=147047 RepID=A0A239AIV7_9BACT|nr:phage tail sheath C-terminal domain-containing protein [Humidesulfovibrio mexicanus]SNR95282.1 Mu-like prophage tail sheath protein gpL [Humidesulfovibrio mexicanus]